MKRCPRCRETKPRDAFFLYPDGVKRYAYCDPCRAGYVASYTWANVEANRAKARRWWHKVGQKRREAARAHQVG